MPTQTATIAAAPTTDAPTTDAPTTDAPTTDAPTTDAPTTDPELERVRDLLGEPSVEVVRLALDAARRIDFIRHEVSRGAAQQDAVADARGVLDQLDVALGAMADAEGAVGGDAAFEDVRSGARRLRTEARRVHSQVTRELFALGPQLEVDAELSAVIDTWSSRGARGELVEVMAQAVDRAVALRDRALAFVEAPPECPGLQDNRVAWTQLVLERTERLRDAVVDRDGPGFDALLARYGRAPLGEDPTAADAESRSCWAEGTPLLGSPDRLADRLTGLEEALAG